MHCAAGRGLVPQPLLEEPLAALLHWQAMAEGAYSPNTLRAQEADGAISQHFAMTGQNIWRASRLS